MVAQNPLLSIGVLAHNEELHIEKALQSLLAQDVFQRLPTEVVVVANGCTDKTAALARRLLAEHRATWSNSGTARVEEIAVAGKANAWNQFVHVFSSPLASMLILMDADITLLNASTISSMVTSIEQNPQAVVCVDRPVKDIEINTKRTFFQRLLVATTPEIDPHNVPLCGQLYCVLSAQARLITLPIQISCEDGFLRALLLTHGFTKPENLRRIILDSDAAHKFASVATLRELFEHEKWIVSGSIINMLLFERFLKECAADRTAMMQMKKWQEQDPEWLPQYIQRQVQEKGWHLLPRSWWTRRWSRLYPLPIGHKLRRIPAAVIATGMDMLVFITAIRDVRCGRAFRYWGRKLGSK